MFAKNGIPLYIQLKKKLLKDIQDNYKPGDLLSPEVKLEKEYEVSRITIRKAIELLERDNVLERKQRFRNIYKRTKNTFMMQIQLAH